MPDLTPEQLELEAHSWAIYCGQFGTDYPVMMAWIREHPELMGIVRRTYMDGWAHGYEFGQVD